MAQPDSAAEQVQAGGEAMSLEIGHRLKLARVGAKLTQQELAEKLGLGNPYVSLIERDKRNLDLELFVRWCRFCGANPAALLAEHLKATP